MRVELCPDHGIETDSICFLFASAAIAKLVLPHGGLRADQRCQTRVTAARGHQQGTREHADEHGQCRLSLRLNAAREVALAQMREFVRDHGGIFVHVARVEQQSQVDADHAAGYGKRIDLGIVDQYRIERGVLEVRMFAQAAATAWLRST